MSEDQEAFYERLKQRLNDLNQWPALYLYKFILPNNPKSKQQLVKIFDNTGAVIQTKASKNGNYISLSIELIMENPDAIVDIYKKASKVDKVILL